jgi:hypothetical protein
MTSGIKCSQSNPEITNTIIWYGGSLYTSESSPVVNYCVLEGGWEGIGNLDANPMLIDPFNDNFNICSQSPCIDSGDPTLLDPDGTRSDIGFFYEEHPLCSFGNLRYVSVSGNDSTGNGSYGNPFRTIQHAVNQSFFYDTVLVMQGIYNENVFIGTKNLVLASNYIFSSDTMDIINTVIDGDSTAGSTIYMRYCDGQSNISGFYFSDANETGDAAINIRSCENIKIENNLFEAFSSGTVINTSFNSNITIFGNIFRYNNCAIIETHDGPYSSIRENLFHDNLNTVILFIGTSHLITENNIINNNEGLVFWCWMIGGPAVFRGNLIYNNHCTWSGGIFFSEDSNILVDNNTICNNTGAYETYLGYFFIEHGGLGPVDFINNIIWGNSYSNPEDTLIYHDMDINFSITYSDVQGGWPGEGNIECDPQFCDPDSGNFYLHYNSCCVGAGQNGENMGVYGVGCWPACSTYVVGDVNGSGVYDGLDIMYGVAFLKGGPAPTIQCECTEGNILYSAGDVNNSCNYNGLDITYGVAYFKGGTSPVPCQDCPPVLNSIRR